MKKLLTIIMIALLIGGAVFLLVFKGGNKFDGTKETPDFEIKDNGLLLNTDKSRYNPKEEVYFQIASLDKDGDSNCEADLELQISGPEDNDIKLTTEDGTISKTPNCGTSGSSNDPDYTAFIEPVEEGIYDLKLTDLKTNEFVGSFFIVGNSEAELSVTRWGPSKAINDGKTRNPMKFILASANDFEGQLIEAVPVDVEIVWQGAASVSTSANQAGKTLTWDISLKAGEEKDLSYEYLVKPGSSGIMTLGKAKLISGRDEVIYEEEKPWIIVVTDN
ncbi:hypothetical protein JXA63_05630 [Candidatus Woesebacteria bacterium]|nr:hypothetical protein [Candidatus Woesebacteria bacterium]